MSRKIYLASACLMAMSLSSLPAFADDSSEDQRIAALEQRIEQLEETNRRLLDFLESQGQIDNNSASIPAVDPVTRFDTQAQGHARAHHQDGYQGHQDHHQAHQQVRHDDRPNSGDDFVGLSSDYSYRILDHAENVNTGPLLQLQAIQNGELNDRVTLGGGVTVLANYQRSNSNSKFGWLMRHPTPSNQIGEEVSEFVVHSAQLQTTARLSDNLTSYIEFLYNPEQSFGSGTITDLNRNQVQVRKAYVLWGDLDQSPWYAGLGKMDTPFGLNDTVNPFTNSTNWHAFAGLAYGGMVGFYNNGFHLRAMAIQGGSQFRAANTSVEGTNVPSRVNNFAVDANYTSNFGNGDSIMFGASYEAGSPYCQNYPVTHFSPCEDNNPAYAVYSRLVMGDFTMIGEFAQTTDVWAGSAVPIPANPLSVFEAQETQSFGIGGRYALDVGAESDLDISFEFSRFRAGDDGAPWERQNQYVAGLSYFLTPNVKMFGELIHTEGWVPLNFLSGGNLPAGATWSERDAKTNVITFGVQAAF